MPSEMKATNSLAETWFKSAWGKATSGNRIVATVLGTWIWPLTDFLRIPDDIKHGGRIMKSEVAMAGSMAGSMDRLPLQSH